MLNDGGNVFWRCAMKTNIPSLARVLLPSFEECDRLEEGLQQVQPGYRFDRLNEGFLVVEMVNYVLEFETGKV